LLGSARFGDRKDLVKLESSGDLVIGRSGRNNKLLRYDGPAHLLTMAPTHSGKGVGTIIPNLLLQTFGVNDLATADMLSRTIGDSHHRI
jgi:type IV secretion system protein VirD4